MQIDSPSGHEEDISTYVLGFLKDLGLKPEIDENYNIYCRIGNKPNPVLFCAHMDTVEPGRVIKPVEIKGYIESEGYTILGADNKVSLSSILNALIKLIKGGNELNIELMFTAREETNSDIQEIDRDKVKSEAGFVFDGGDGNLGWLTQTTPTIEDFKIEIFGQTAHASSPEKGHNILEVLLDLKDRIKLGRPDEYTTLNIGLINGGYSTNSVPANLKLDGDLRSTNNISFAKVKDDLIQALETSCKKYNTKVEFSWIPYSLGYSLDLSGRNFKKVYAFYSKHNIQIDPSVVTSGSDAAFLNSIGIETFCLGDGVVDAHKLTERIKISDFVKLSEIVEDLMLNYRY